MSVILLLTSVEMHTPSSNRASYGHLIFVFLSSDSVLRFSRMHLTLIQLSCILCFNYWICRRVKFCLRKPTEAEIKAQGASVVIAATLRLKYKQEYHSGCMDLICLNSRRKDGEAQSLSGEAEENTNVLNRFH